MDDVTIQRGATRGTVPDRTDVRRPRHRSLRSELAHAYSAAYGRTCHHTTLTALEAIVLWLRRCERAKGPTIFRSMPQAFRGIGWPTTGNIRADRQRHRNQLARRLDMLIEMGVVESWEPHWKGNGVGRGILVELRRDSSVGEAILAAAARHARKPPRRPGGPSCAVASAEPPGRRSRACAPTHLSPPLRENSVPRVPAGTKSPSRDTSSRLQNGRRASCARAGRPPSAAAVARDVARASEDGGRGAVAALPWLADVEPAVLLRGAVLAVEPAADLRVSAESRRIVEAAVAELDRYDGRGAGAAAIIDLAAGGWELHPFAGRTGKLAVPRTAGALAKPLRQRARMARRAADLHAEGLL